RIVWPITRIEVGETPASLLVMVEIPLGQVHQLVQQTGVVLEQRSGLALDRVRARLLATELPDVAPGNPVVVRRELAEHGLVLEPDDAECLEVVQSSPALIDGSPREACREPERLVWKRRHQVWVSGVPAQRRPIGDRDALGLPFEQANGLPEAAIGVL